MQKQRYIIIQKFVIGKIFENILNLLNSSLLKYYYNLK